MVQITQSAERSLSSSSSFKQKKEKKEKDVFAHSLLPHGEESSSEAEEEEDKQEEDEEGVVLAFRDLQCTVSYPSGGSHKSQKKTILFPISGVIEAGSVVGIMGASGSGKTTLLDILSQKKKSHSYTGTVYINRTKRNPQAFKKLSIYAPQENLFNGNETVREALEFAALLRSGRRRKKEEQKSLIDATLAFLGLDHVAHQRVGNAVVRGISGGQKRRLVIGRVLVTHAKLAFCDEPTSGLSSTDTESLFVGIREVAKTFKITFIIVIHQPRTEVFQLFDYFILLAQGRCIYNGPRSDMEAYFASQGYPLPRYVNPAEFYVSLMSQGREGESAVLDKLASAYATQRAIQIETQLEQALGRQRASSSSSSRSSFSSTLARRERDREESRFRIFSNRRVCALTSPRNSQKKKKKESHACEAKNAFFPFSRNPHEAKEEREGEVVGRQMEEREESHEEEEEEKREESQEEEEDANEAVGEEEEEEERGGSMIKRRRRYSDEEGNEISQKARERRRRRDDRGSTSTGVSSSFDRAHDLILALRGSLSHDTFHKEREGEYLRPGFGGQFVILARRSFTLAWRDRNALSMMAGTAILVSILTSLFFFNVYRDKPIIYHLSALLLLSLSLGCIPAVHMTFYLEKKVAFLYETSDGFYTPAPYLLAETCVGVCLLVGLTFLSLILVIPCCGFPFIKFPQIFLIFILALMVVDGVMQFFAAVCSTYIMANTFSGGWLGLTSVINGFNANAKSMPLWLTWLLYLSPFFYLTEGIAIILYAGDNKDIFGSPEKAEIFGYASSEDLFKAYGFAGRLAEKERSDESTHPQLDSSSSLLTPHEWLWAVDIPVLLLMTIGMKFLVCFYQAYFVKLQK